MWTASSTFVLSLALLFIVQPPSQSKHVWACLFFLSLGLCYLASSTKAAVHRWLASLPCSLCSPSCTYSFSWYSCLSPSSASCCKGYWSPSAVALPSSCGLFIYMTISASRPCCQTISSHNCYYGYHYPRYCYSGNNHTSSST